MWLMLQQTKAEDFVLATGETHPVREFVEKAFACVGVKLRYGHTAIHSHNLIGPSLDGKALESMKRG
jgi:GDPmannose 4,6-dehydratase